MDTLSSSTIEQTGQGGGGGSRRSSFRNASNPMLVIPTVLSADTINSRVSSEDEQLLNRAVPLRPLSIIPPLPQDSPVDTKAPPSPKPSVRSVRSVRSTNSVRPASVSLTNANIFVSREVAPAEKASLVSFTSFFVYIFLSGMVIGNLCLIVEMPFIHEITDFKNLTLLVSFWVTNLVISFWTVFGFFFTCSYASSKFMIDVALWLAVLTCVFLSVWSFYFFEIYGTIACLVYIILGFLLLAGGVFGGSKTVFDLLASLPDDDKTIDIWTSCWRYFAIATIPVLSSFISTQGNPGSFFSLVLFAIVLSLICVNFKIQAAFRPSAPPSTILLATLSVKAFALLYGPAVGLIVIFAILYITEISFFQNSDPLFISLLVIFAALLLFYCTMAFAFFSRNPYLKWFNPMTPEDYSKLEAARVRAQAMKHLSLNIRGNEAELRRQREEEIKLLYEIEARIADLHTGLSFTDCIVYLFMFGIAVCIPMLLVEAYWFKANPKILEERPIWIFNLLATSWTLFGLTFCASYAPSPRVLRIAGILTAIFFLLMSVWIYNRLNVIEVIFFAGLTLWCIFVAVLSNQIHKKFSSFPIEDATLGVWFASWRFYGIVTVPIVAYFASLKTEAGSSFLLIIIFVIMVVFLLCIVRVGFALKKKILSSVPGLSKQFTIRQFLVILGPLIMLGLIFMVLYVIVLVGFSSASPNNPYSNSSIISGETTTSSSSTSDTGVREPDPPYVTALLTIALVLIVCVCVLVLLYLSNLDRFKFALPFTEQDYSSLALTTERAIAMREQIRSVDHPLLELQKQRRVLQNMLGELDQQLDLLYGTTWTQDWQITTVLVYSFLALNASFVVLLFVEIVALLANLTSLAYDTSLFFVFNLIAVGSFSLTTLFCIMYAPSVWVVRASSLVACIGYALIVAWCFAPGNSDYGFAAGTFVIYAIFFFGVIILSESLYDNLTCLPVEDSTLQVWFTAIRFFFVMLIRLMQLRFTDDQFNTQHSSQTSFLAISMYTTAVACLCCNLRLSFAINPFARNVPALFRQQSWRSMQRYVSVFGLILLFVIFFVIEIAGFGRNIYNWIFAILLTFAFFFNLYYAFNAVIFLLHIEKLSFFNWYSEDDYIILQQARSQSPTDGFELDRVSALSLFIAASVISPPPAAPPPPPSPPPNV